MNTRISLITIASIALTQIGRAQDAASPLKVEIKDAKPAAVQTPQFQASNVPAKAWRPKNWMEVDVGFDVKKKPTPGDTSTFVDALEFRFYIALNKMDRSTPPKRLLLTGTVHAQNIPLKEKSHVLVYISPATLTRVLEKATFTEADISDIGIEVLAGGQTVGAHSKINKKWWESLDAFSTVGDAVLPKIKTPFASLWGDYDVDVKAN
jgi:hypothetical protein